MLAAEIPDTGFQLHSSPAKMTENNKAPEYDIRDNAERRETRRRYRNLICTLQGLISISIKDRLHVTDVSYSDGQLFGQKTYIPFVTVCKLFSLYIVFF